MIYGPYNIKLINAQQAKKAHTYENNRIKLYKCIAAIWYNKTYQIATYSIRTLLKMDYCKSETC